jgi:hypothetical protein
LHNRPVDPAIYATHPRVNREHGIKPAGLINLGSRLILAVEAQNFGDDPSFNRQTNAYGWLIVSEHFGRTWDVEATPRDFFTGRVASCHFVQYGRGDANVVGGYVHASFLGASDDGASYWENGDYVLLGRAPADRLLERAAWEFWTSSDANGPRWSRNEEEAAPVFRFDKMTGENHISYAAPLKRYLGNLTRRASRARTISFPGRRAPIEASSIFSKPPRCGAPDRCSIATTRGERTGTTSQCFQ